MNNSNPYLNNSAQYAPPMPVFPPPVVFYPLMPEQLPKPPSDMNYNLTTPLQSRLGTAKTNPIVEHYDLLNEEKYLDPITFDSQMQ